MQSMMAVAAILGSGGYGGFYEGSRARRRKPWWETQTPDEAQEAIAAAEAKREMRAAKRRAIQWTKRPGEVQP